MVMYTELSIRCRIKEDAPDFVIETLRVMSSKDSERVLPEETKHFGDSRIIHMLHSCSYYLHPVTMQSFVYDGIANQWMFAALCNLKNYESEIETFIEWLTPYIDAYEGEFLGHRLYEEDDHPILLYHPNNWVQLPKTIGEN